MNKLASMDLTNQAYREIIANGVKYSVPRFQRDYAWNLEQWEDLWSDIETLNDEHYHYMGYIVLQNKGDHVFEVIDGQQRLVTLSLIVLAALKHIQSFIDQGLDVSDNEDRLKLLRDRFVGAKNSISLRVENKLSLNRNNGTYFKSICSNLELPTLRGLTQTNRLLGKAFQFFEKKEMGNTGSEVAQFIESFSAAMVFTKIVVQNDLNAYKVFETLNARGVKLSTPDLLKNYIFSVVTKNHDVPDEELQDLDERWSEIISQLGESNFTDFVRYHHNFQAKLVTKKELFSSVRKLANTPERAYAYLQSLAEYAPIYASLLRPYDEWWFMQGDVDPSVRRYLEGLNLFNIKQPFTVLMIAYKNFSREEFAKLVRYLYVLSVRYNVICHLSPNEQEMRYNQMAMKIFTEQYTRASHVKNGEEFKGLYPVDAAFMNAFEFYKMPSRQSSKKIRFLLAEIESGLGSQVDYTKAVLEHICPYNHHEGWVRSFGEGINDIQDRLGNMILLEKDDLNRSSFEEKKVFYASTGFRLAAKVSEYSEWTLQYVNDYQAWLAKKAVNIWKAD